MRIYSSPPAILPDARPFLNTDFRIFTFRWMVLSDSFPGASACSECSRIFLHTFSLLTFNMTHSMGLAVLNLENKDIPKTRRFVNDNYTYYYPSYEHRVTTEPTKGKDYTDNNTKQTVSASTVLTSLCFGDMLSPAPRQ